MKHRDRLSLFFLSVYSFEGQNWKEEQKENNLPILTTAEIKTEILTALNKENLPKKNSLSFTLNQLHLNVKTIRDHLFLLYEEGKLDKEFKHALDHSLEKGTTSIKVSL